MARILICDNGLIARYRCLGILKLGCNGLSLLVWDAEGSPPLSESVSVLWRGFLQDTATDTISIPSLIEGNSDNLRERFLAWVYELGNTIIRGRSLVDDLELRPGFS